LLRSRTLVSFSTSPECSGTRSWTPRCGEWKIEYGDIASNGLTVREPAAGKKTIYVKRLDAKTVASILAHEVGHAINPGCSAPQREKETRDEFAKRYVEYGKLDEGRAHLNELERNKEMGLHPGTEPSRRY